MSRRWSLLKARAVFEREFKSLEKYIYANARSDERTKLLVTTPGVGVIAALTYASAMDDPSRFKSHPALCLPQEGESFALGLLLSCAVALDGEGPEVGG